MVPPPTIGSQRRCRSGCGASVRRNWASNARAFSPRCWTNRFRRARWMSIRHGFMSMFPSWTGAENTNRERKAKIATQKWNRRFYFKLSQDPELKKDVIESGPKRWSFFNPFRRLASGRWYWTYGLAPAESPDKPVWHNEVFSFVITGSEFAPTIPPTADDLLRGDQETQDWSRDDLHDRRHRTFAADPHMAGTGRTDARQLREGTRETARLPSRSKSATRSIPLT